MAGGRYVPGKAGIVAAGAQRTSPATDMIGVTATTGTASLAPAQPGALA